MNTEISGVILQWTLLVALCYPLGRYIAKVYRGERTWLDFMAPVERGIYRFCGIDPAVEMNWKQFLKALLTVNLFWFFWGMLLLVFQGWLPLNPDGNPGQSPDLAFNTCISFMVNCNLQHYSGETGLSYFTQLFVIMLFQFVTAACGMAAMAGMMKALAGKTTKTIGNFWVFLTRSVTRILLPLSLAVGILLVINGTPMSFDGKQTLTTLEGAEQVISQGPTAAIVPIKQLGTNGGGYFGTNSAHPLENPNAFTNILECWSILILPMAMVFAFGFYTRRRRLATWIFGVMLLAYTAGVVLSVWQETGGSRQIDGMGISQELDDSLAKYVGQEYADLPVFGAAFGMAALQALWFTGAVFRKLAYPARIAGFGACGLPVLALCAWAGPWFPLDDPGVWAAFAIVYLFILAGVTAGYTVYFKKTAGGYDQALARYREKNRR